ncbi:MAG: hypothetical protein NTZ42_02155 [Candidatus Gribaldobacteria bacterium]|nr:hypothetical protein [Candidatus Gribaldobacteria bacterium]
MKKKIIVGLVGVVAIVAVAGGFFWWQNRLTPVEKWGAIAYTDAKDYIVTDTPNGKLVENKKEGLSFIVPSDWVRTNKDTEGDAMFLSPDAKIKEGNQMLEQGCKIVAAVAKVKTNIDVLEQYLKENFSWSSNERSLYERLKIANYPTIRNSFDNSKLGVYFDNTHIVTSKALYEVVLEASEQNKESCKTIFETTLKTITIK